MRTAISLAEHLTLARAAHQRHHFHHAIRELERRLDRIGQATAIIGLEHQSIDDHAYVVIHAAIELRWVGEFDHIAIDPRAHKPLFPSGLEQLTEFTLATAHEWRQHFELGARIAEQHHIGDLRRALPLHRTSAIRAMRHTGAGPQQAEVVVHLGHRADSRPRVVPRRFLFN